MVTIASGFHASTCSTETCTSPPLPERRRDIRRADALDRLHVDRAGESGVETARPAAVVDARTALGRNRGDHARRRRRGCPARTAPILRRAPARRGSRRAAAAIPESGRTRRRGGDTESRSAPARGRRARRRSARPSRSRRSGRASRRARPRRSRCCRGRSAGRAWAGPHTSPERTGVPPGGTAWSSRAASPARARTRASTPAGRPRRRASTFAGTSARRPASSVTVRVACARASDGASANAAAPARKRASRSHAGRPTCRR